MTNYCCSSPFPTFASLYSDIISELSAFPPSFIPSIPSLFYPSFGNIGFPNLERFLYVTGFLMLEQYLTTSLNVISPLLAFLGLASSIIPTIPMLNLSLPDLLSANVSDLISSIASSIPSIFTTLENSMLSSTIYFLQVCSNYVNTL
jgi:hypothetical protein